MNNPISSRTSTLPTSKHNLNNCSSFRDWINPTKKKTNPHNLYTIYACERNTCYMYEYIRMYRSRRHGASRHFESGRTTTDASHEAELYHPSSSRASNAEQLLGSGDRALSAPALCCSMERGEGPRNGSFSPSGRARPGQGRNEQNKKRKRTRLGLDDRQWLVIQNTNTNDKVLIFTKIDNKV